MLFSLVAIWLAFGNTYALPQRNSDDIPTYTKLSQDQVSHLQINNGFGPTAPSQLLSFHASDQDSSSAQERPSYDDSYLYSHQNVISSAKPVTRPVPQNIPHSTVIISKPKVNYPSLQHQYQNKGPSHRIKTKSKEEEEELQQEIDEPDRLSQLLPQTKFNCLNKNTGYYADEELACEVFHYCQDNVRHSWICPEGFTFHQIHLICMPPSKEGICQKSSQFHFVNEYLYKPLNLEEHEQRPNTSLRYSERYYPDNYQLENDNQPVLRTPLNQNNLPKHLVEPVRSTYRPDLAIGQEFRASSPLNVPIHLRRPVYYQQK